MNKNYSFSQNLSYFLAEFKERNAIIANGLQARNPDIIKYIAASQLIIACDGAIRHLPADMQVDYVIGDGDSAPSVLPGQVRHPYIHDSDQETNDLTKAVNFLAKQAPTSTPLLICAASGLREDHSIANFALLPEFANRFPTLAMLSDFGVFRVCNPPYQRLAVIPGQQISFFSLNPECQINAQQLKWPLNKARFNRLNSGILNQATSHCLEISCSHPLIVYIAFEAKSS